MRTRDNIWKDEYETWNAPAQREKMMVELLMDIRDLLTKP